MVEFLINIIQLQPTLFLNFNPTMTATDAVAVAVAEAASTTTLINVSHLLFLRYVYSKLTGKCMRAFLTETFGEDPDAPIEYRQSCCESCDSQNDEMLYDAKEDFMLLLGAIMELKEKSSEKKVINLNTYDSFSIKILIKQTGWLVEC